MTKIFAASLHLMSPVYAITEILGRPIKVDCHATISYYLDDRIKIKTSKSLLLDPGPGKTSNS